MGSEAISVRATEAGRGGGSQHRGRGRRQMEPSAQGKERDLDAPLLMVGSVRALAMLGVFAMHATIFSFFYGYGWPGRDFLLEAGRAGVAVFFVLAGFLLYLPFAMARLSGGPPPALGAYYLRRGLRIIPASWVALLIYALYFHWDYVFTAKGVVTYFGFLQVYDAQWHSGGITPAWAVDDLVLFYLLLPLWSRMMRAVPAPDMRAFVRTEAATLGALIVASLAWKVLAYRLTDTTQGGALPGDPLLIVLPAFMDYFAFGMAFAVAFLAVSASGAGSRAVAVIRRAPGIPVLAAAAIFCAIVAFDPWVEPGVLRGYDDVLLFLAHVLTGVAAVVLLLTAAFGSPRTGVVTRVLAGRALLWFGVVSYGFFLWHGAMLGELHAQFPLIPSLPWV